eukprot:9125656-Pyramimonas_sp.AAC.1
MAQPIGGHFSLDGRRRNLWRNQLEDVPFSAAAGATYGATNGRAFYSRRPRAQPIGRRFILGGRGRNLRRNQ